MSRNRPTASPAPIPLGSSSEGVAVAGVRHHHILPTPLIRFERTKRSPLTTVSAGPMRRSRQDELAKRQWPTAAAPEFSPRPTNTPSTAPLEVETYIASLTPAEFQAMMLRVRVMR